MRILYYGDPGLYPSFGGVRNVSYYLVNALKPRVDIRYYPPLNPKKGSMFRFLGVNQKFLTRQFDIIHFNMIPSWRNGSQLLLKLAKKVGSSTILNIHGIIQIERAFKKNPNSVPDNAVQNALSSISAADKIVVNSKYMYDRVIKWYEIAPNKIVIIPNGVEMIGLGKRTVKNKLSGDPSILYLGLLNKMKGVDVLIQAVANLKSEHPNMKLHIVGPGPISEFERLAKKKGIEDQIIFYGRVPHSAVAYYYTSADIFVFPSRHEAFGITILEAMASGIPVIASEIGGIPEIISDSNNGLLFRSEDVEALSKAILKLSRDSALRMKISRNALKTAENYSWDNIAKKYISLYRQLRE